MIAIRRGARADLDALERIENAAFAGDRISRRGLAHSLKATTMILLVAESGEAQGGRIAGYGLVHMRRGSRIGRVTSLAVAPDRPRGAGRALLAGLEDEARATGLCAMRLEVRIDNDRAIALYRAAGYRQIGSYSDYYEDGATALRFEKPLAAVA